MELIKGKLPMKIEHVSPLAFLNCDSNDLDFIKVNSSYF
jgi:hypothetical protein